MVDHIQKKWSCGHKTRLFSAHINESPISINDSVSAKRSVNRVITEDPVEVSDHLEAELALAFKLLDPVYLGGTVTSPDDIKLQFELEDKNYLTGFLIKVKNLEADSIESAIQKANRITNILSYTTGIFIYHNRPEVVKIKDGVQTTVKSTSSKPQPFNLDLNNKKVKSMLGGDPDLTQQLAHVARGLKAVDENDPVETIREFDKAIEDENISHLEKYGHLRNGLSHLELDQRTTNALKNQFSIDCITNTETGKKSLDTTHPDTRKKLLVAAQKFKDEVVSYFNKKYKF